MASIYNGSIYRCEKSYCIKANVLVISVQHLSRIVTIWHDREFLQLFLHTSFDTSHSSTRSCEESNSGNINMGAETWNCSCREEALSQTTVSWEGLCSDTAVHKQPTLGCLLPFCQRSRTCKDLCRIYSLSGTLSR